MDEKGRIGLIVAVIAAAVSIVLAMAAFGETPPTTPPGGSNSPLKDCFGGLGEQTTASDRTFTTPNNCAAFGNLNTNSIMNNLCDSARTRWTSLAQGKCHNFMQPLPCQMTGLSWITTHLTGATELRTCEEDPGHFAKLTCTIKSNVFCGSPGTCEKDCEDTVFTDLKTACMQACTIN